MTTGAGAVAAASVAAMSPTSPRSSPGDQYPGVFVDAACSTNSPQLNIPQSSLSGSFRGAHFIPDVGDTSVAKLAVIVIARDRVMHVMRQPVAAPAFRRSRFATCGCRGRRCFWSMADLDRRRSYAGAYPLRHHGCANVKRPVISRATPCRSRRASRGRVASDDWDSTTQLPPLIVGARGKRASASAHDVITGNKSLFAMVATGCCPKGSPYVHRSRAGSPGSGRWRRCRLGLPASNTRPTRSKWKAAFGVAFRILYGRPQPFAGGIQADQFEWLDCRRQ